MKDIYADTQPRVEDHSEDNDRSYNRPPGWGRNADGTGPGRLKGGSAQQRARFRLKYAIQCKGPNLVKRLFTLSNSKDGPTAVSAIRLLLAYGWGRPTIHVEVEGNVTKRYMAVMPPTLAHEEWMAMVRQQTAPVLVEESSTNPATNGHPTSSNGHVRP